MRRRQCIISQLLTYLLNRLLNFCFFCCCCFFFISSLFIGEGKYAKELKSLRENIVRYVLFNTTDSSLFILKEANNQSNLSVTELNRTRLERRAILSIEQIATTSALDSAQYTGSSAQNFTKQPSSSDDESVIIDYLVEFRNKIIEIERDYKFHGQNCTEYSRWNFFSSLLFTITVMSTVGYGKS
jgi:ABC-type transport system involved in multi-copper enzyme maturation permease subunit